MFKGTLLSPFFRHRMKNKCILLLNGPNLNMLGQRETKYYGEVSLVEIIEKCRVIAKGSEIELITYQSNHEGVLIDKIQEMSSTAGAIIINAGAYSHTSLALRDALAIVTCPVIEVHLSNIYTREKYRHHSYISEVATGVIAGFQEESYYLAMEVALKLLQ